MKKLLIIALLAASFEAHAEACAPLDFEEMKDMSTPELTQTYCSYHQEWQKRLKLSVYYLDEDMMKQADACEAQVQRLLRQVKKRSDGTQAIIDKCPMAYY